MDRVYYITSQKLKELKEEYQRIKQALLAQSQSGEVPRFLYSEEPNEEFVLFQENLTLLHLKKRELEDILRNYKLIKLPPKRERNRVHLGAHVVVEVNGEEDEFQIVGTLEANPLLGKISNESPVGSALMGKKVGDEIIISSPVKTVYKIKKIKYQKE
jgi:transcription elongation factor GreA